MALYRQKHLYQTKLRGYSYDLGHNMRQPEAHPNSVCRKIHFRLDKN